MEKIYFFICLSSFPMTPFQLFENITNNTKTIIFLLQLFNDQNTDIQ